MSELKEEREPSHPHQGIKYHYELGEEIANGVRYWGQEVSDKKMRITARCICPRCGELWRVVLASVRAGYTKSCGCRK